MTVVHHALVVGVLTVGLGASLVGAAAALWLVTSRLVTDTERAEAGCFLVVALLVALVCGLALWAVAG